MSQRLTVKNFQSTVTSMTVDRVLPLGIPVSTYFLYPTSVASYQLPLHQALLSLNGSPRFSSEFAE